MPLGAAMFSTVMIVNLPGKRIFPISKGRRNREGLRQRLGQSPGGHPVGVWRDDLPTAGHKAAQQLCPQILVVWLHHQIQILILAASETVFVRHIGGNLVGSVGEDNPYWHPTAQTLSAL